MKIFVDTNIFLDVLLQREEAKNSVIVLNSVKEGLCEGVVLDITLLNIAYIAKRQSVDIKDFLLMINRYFRVVGADNMAIQEALNIFNNDFEDSVQYVCANRFSCDAIITNDESFFRGEIRLLSAREFSQQRAFE